MPVAVIALAAGSFAAGASAFVAAGTMAGMVAAGATMAGAALTIVGTITGNQKLTKIGAIVGIAGGLGSMAVSAGADAAAAGASDAAASGASDAASSTAASAAGDAAVQTVPVAAPGPIDAISGTDAAGSTAAGSAATGSAAAGSAVPAVAPGAPAAGTGMLDSGTSTTAAQAVGGNGNDFLAQSLADPSAPYDPSKVAAGTPANAFDASATQVAQSGQPVDMTGFKTPTPNPFSTPTAGQTGGGMIDSISPYNSQINAAAAADTTATSGIGATVDQVSAWAKSNPELAKAALNATGAIAQNLVPSAKDRAMMQAYQQQAKLTAAQTATLNRRALWGSGRIS